LQREDSAGGSRKAQGYVPIDPVKVHQVIRDRLNQLNDQLLPPNERLSCLVVDDLVVSPGYQNWHSPLIDLHSFVPYSQATPEAILALIRHPQAGLRYFQRFSVVDEGQAVWAKSGKVLDALDQGITTTVYVYVAVEGRMLYIEFVSAVMPPVKSVYRQIDTWLNLSAGGFFLRSLRVSFARVLHDLFYAPGRAWRALRAQWAERSFLKKVANMSISSARGEFGVVASAREAGARGDLGTYLQKLDAGKYTKLAERLVNDAVIDYLADMDVNVSAYAQSAANVMNNTFIGNNNSAFGPGANVENYAPGQRIQQAER